MNFGIFEHFPLETKHPQYTFLNNIRIFFPFGLLPNFFNVAKVILAELVEISYQYNVCHSHYGESLIDEYTILVFHDLFSIGINDHRKIAVKF